MRFSFLIFAAVLATAYGWRHLGCFRDHGNRAIKGGIRFRGSVARCAAYARAHHWRVFGVQYGGECFTNANAHRTYGRYGRAGNCRHGTGGGWANDVYEVSGWRHWYHHSVWHHRAVVYKHHYLFWRRMAGHVRSHLHSYNVRYAASSHLMSRYARQNNYWVRRANAQARMVNTLKRYHDYYARKYHATRRAYNHNLIRMARVANLKARLQKIYYHRYWIYRRRALFYRKKYYWARRLKYLRARQRNKMYATYRKYNSMARVYWRKYHWAAHHH